MGVDSLDKKYAINYTWRRTRRWLMAVFLHTLDISGANPYVLYQSNEDYYNDIARVNFMINLPH